MKLTKFSYSKIKWLLNHTTFKNSPLKISIRILKWEILRFLGIRVSYSFDNQYNVFLYPNDGCARLTFYFGYHEKEIFAFLDNYLEQGMIVVDVGANIGLFSLFCAKRVGENGLVFAYEPNMQSFHRFQENIMLNKITNIIVKQVAIGHKKGKALFKIVQDSSRSFVQIIDNSKIYDYVVDLGTLDDELSSISKIDYLKIDTEGFEYFVLKGAEAIINKLKPTIIQVEIYNQFLSRNNVQKTDIFYYLIKLNYHPKYVINGQLVDINDFANFEGNALFAKFD